MISSGLEKIASAITESLKPSFASEYLPTIAAIATALLSVIFGYLISRRLERIKNEREIHMVFLEEVNSFYMGIHELYRNSVNINKLLDTIELKDANEYAYLNSEDYASNAIRMKKLKARLSNVNSTDVNANLYRQHKQLMDSIIDRFLDFNLFIELGEILNIKAMPYSLLVKKSIETKYLNLIEYLAVATTNNMQDFNLKYYREECGKLITDIKNEITRRI